MKKPNDFHKAMQAHGFKKGDGKHKRHPATDGYKAPPVDQAAYRSFKK